MTPGTSSTTSEAAADVADEKRSEVPRDLLERIAGVLDRTDPVPLYHQVASVLRWEIGMGRAAVGEVLPPIRLVAERLGLHYHTVRKAYETLARDGVIESRRGVGTTVVERPKRVSWSPFVAAPETDPAAARVWVVECNATQSVWLARQVADVWGAVAVPWLLEGYGEPPPGPILGSTFHAAEMRRSWPNRHAEIHALGLALDAGAGERVAEIAAMLRVKRLVVVERDPGTAHSVAAELSAVLPPGGPTLHGIVGVDPERVVEQEEDALVVYAPRVWDGLPWRIRSHPRAVTLPLSFSTERLADLRSNLWGREE